MLPSLHLKGGIFLPHVIQPGSIFFHYTVHYYKCENHQHSTAQAMTVGSSLLSYVLYTSLRFTDDHSDGLTLS